MSEGLIAKRKWWEWIETKKDRIFLTERAKKRYGEWFPAEGKVVKSGKEVLFPSGEEMYRYLWAGEEWKIEEREVSGEFSFLFLLPCEARAIIEVTDKVFLHLPVDKNYWLRRKALSLGILACLQPEPTCFCSLVGGGPFWRDEEALFLVPRKEDIYIQGEGELLAFSEEGGEKIKEEMQALQQEVENELPSPLPSYFPQELYHHFEDEEWNELSWRCLNCGACTFLCPTCYCFDIQVKMWGDEGYRFRCYDSCMYSEYTMMAGGHNPRPTTKEKFRNRFLHKLEFFYERYGRSLCTGCGRCIAACPNGISIARVIEELKEADPDA
ncbi:MAG: hypothetical protein PWP57_558 [Candidatus Atribacteria bacterium]|nr:hypothetical protein [Candidatus Atribacteria bacterium]